MLAGRRKRKEPEPKSDSEVDAEVDELMKLASADNEGGKTSSAWKNWAQWRRSRGLPPDSMGDVEDTPKLQLQHEREAMRFILYLTEKANPCQPDTASAQWSTVAAILHRKHGFRIGADIRRGDSLVRVAALVKALWKQRGGRASALKRKPMSASFLRRAFDKCLSDVDNKGDANKRAMLACGLQMLLRGSELGRGDKLKWAAKRGLTRADFKIETKSGAARRMTALVAPAKSSKTLGHKSTPVTIGAGGRYIDAVAEMENLRRVDPVPEALKATTPAFRNAKGEAFSVREISKLIKNLMTAIGMGSMRWSSHSLRIGGATCLYRQGADSMVVMTLGRWSSDAYLKYIRDELEVAIRWSNAIGSTELTTDEVNHPFMELEESDLAFGLSDVEVP